MLKYILLFFCTVSLIASEDVYPNNLKIWKFGKEAPQNFDSERATIAEWQGASEGQNSEKKPTLPKTKFSSCLGICVFGPRAEQVRVRHIDPNGLGYRTGYSSLDLLLTVPNMQCRFLPLLDLRGHVFNDGKWAANGGLGLRYLSDRLAHVFGANIFYDYRSSKHKNFYDQVSIGLEALGKKWDYRANGYIVVGGKRSHPYNFAFDLDTFLLTARREYAMSGFDAELGYHFPKMKMMESYAAIGPYFYCSQKADKNTTGGRLRLVLDFYKYLNVEGILSYDHLFRWIGQGAVSLNFPFGPRKSVTSDGLPLQERLYQQIQHNEIIVVKSRRKKL